ncbi:MAG: EAL domain-containing protein [Campylobacterota bacterium]
MAHTKSFDPGFFDYERILDDLFDMVFIVDIESRKMVYINAMARQITGYDLKTLNEKGIENFREPMQGMPGFQTHLRQLQEKKQLIDRAHLHCANGQMIPVEAKTKAVAYGGREYSLAIVRDISQVLQKENKLKTAVDKNVALLKSYKDAIDESAIVSKSDKKGRITYANQNFCDLTGYTPQEVVGKPHNIVRHPDTPKEVFRQMWQKIKSKQVWKGKLKNRKKDGTHYWVDITIMPILDQNNDIKEYIGVRHDITELVESQQELKRIASTDSLTGRGNRFSLLSDIESARRPAMAIIDIDHFNEINDFYGSSFGDAVLTDFGSFLQQQLQESSYRLYRLHGDEFAILCDCEDKNVFMDFIQRVHENIKNRAFYVQDKPLSLQTTVTVSFEKSSVLLSTADMAKKYAKKNRLHFFVYDSSLDLNKEYESNLKWSAKLQKAFEQDRIIPYYHGIYNNTTGKIEKYECLVRMVEKEGKVISPFFFLDVAKRSKQYIKLTKKMIDSSFAYFANRQEEFSLNITLEDIQSDSLQEYLFAKLAKYGIGKRLVIEMVESEGIDSKNQKVVSFISRLREFGVQIAIDDFGTGYSNFEYLIKLQADYIKIDGSMIKNIDKDRDSEEIVKTIIDFAKKRGMKTVAEFVSNEGVFAKVKALGIDYSQGFLLHEPAPEV